VIDFLGHTIKGGEISPREESVTKTLRNAKTKE